MSWVFERSTTAGATRLVLLAIANHADKDGRNSWASVSALSLEAHCSERQARYALRELEKAGEIVEVGVSPRRTHVYELPLMATLFPDSQEGADIAPAESAGGNLRPMRGQSATIKGAQAAPEPSLTTQNRPFSINRSFDAFWKTYPRKVGKPKAMLAYKRALKIASSEQILDGASRYAADPNRADEFTAHPTTWLNRAGWDDPPEPERSPRGQRRPADPPRPYDPALAEIEIERARHG
jgi:hypothetical protein